MPLPLKSQRNPVKPHYVSGEIPKRKRTTHQKYATNRVREERPREPRPVYKELDQTAYAPSPMGELKARLGGAKSIKGAISIDLATTHNPIKTLNNLKHFIMFEGSLGFKERASEKNPVAQLEFEGFPKTKLGEDLGKEYERLASLLNPKNHLELRKAVLFQAIESLKAGLAQEIINTRKQEP